MMVLQKVHGKTVLRAGAWHSGYTRAWNTYTSLQRPWVGVPATLLPFQLPTNTQHGKQQLMIEAFGSCHPCENPDRIPGARLHRNPALAAASIWGMKQ